MHRLELGLHITSPVNLIRTVDCVLESSQVQPGPSLPLQWHLHAKRLVALIDHLDRRYLHAFLLHLQTLFREYLIGVAGDVPILVPVHSILPTQFGDRLNGTCHPLLDACTCRSVCRRSNSRRHLRSPGGRGPSSHSRLHHLIGPSKNQKSICQR